MSKPGLQLTFFQQWSIDEVCTDTCPLDEVATAVPLGATAACKDGHTNTPVNSSEVQRCVASEQEIIAPASQGDSDALGNTESPAAMVSENDRRASTGMNNQCDKAIAGAPDTTSNSGESAHDAHYNSMMNSPKPERRPEGSGPDIEGPESASERSPNTTATPKMTHAPRQQPAHVAETACASSSANDSAASLQNGDKRRCSDAEADAIARKFSFLNSHVTLYRFLYDEGREDVDGRRVLEIGHARIAAGTKLSDRTLRRRIPDLLAAEVLEVPRTYTAVLPNSYRICSPDQLLGRRPSQ